MRVILVITRTWCLRFIECSQWVQSGLHQSLIKESSILAVPMGCCMRFTDLRSSGRRRSIQSKLCLKSRKSFLDRVSTGSGSDLVSDQQAIFPNDFDSLGLTRSLSLPVLTRCKCDSYF